MFNSHFIFFNTLNYNINFFSYSSLVFSRDTLCFVHYFDTHDDSGYDFANFSSRLGCEGGFFLFIRLGNLELIMKRPYLFQ